MKKVMLFLFMAIVATASCNTTNSDDGIKKRVIVENPNGRAVKVGDVIIITSEFKLNDNPMPNNPEPMPLIIKEPERAGDLYAALLLMKEGESMEFSFDPASYFGEQRPPMVEENDTVHITVNILSVMSEEEYIAEMNRREQEFLDAQIKEIEQYMADNKLKGIKTESGLFYVCITEGSGPQVKNGQIITTHYTGTLLDGTKFDSSLDRNEPFQVVVGHGRVIKGWDEGLQLMKVGEKSKLIIPSVLGYGSRDMGTIPPNSILVFDMEILSVE